MSYKYCLWIYPEPILNTMDLSVNEIIENHKNELSVNLMEKK